MQRQLGLDLHPAGLGLRGKLHPIHTQIRPDTGRQVLRPGVPCHQVERALPLQGEVLLGPHLGSPRNDLHHLLDPLLRDGRGNRLFALPLLLVSSCLLAVRLGERDVPHRNAVGHVVHHFELTDFEHGAQHSGLQAAPPRHRLISIQGPAQLLGLQVELRPHQPLEERHTTCSANDLHGADLLHRHRCPVYRSVQHGLDLPHHRLAHLLELIPVDLGAEVLVVHEHLHVRCGFKVSTEDLLSLGGGVFQLEPGLAVGQRVALVLLLESCCKILHQTPVHVSSAAVAVACS
mmetsp:Transcript_15720/g.37952  ORF Transcript_15720/g.37952 Transcript_15720/m.37952 type:complete len:290 (+) Transcript_15720:255-1124(+)